MTTTENTQPASPVSPVNFDAPLQLSAGAMAMHYLALPFDPTQLWPVRNRLRVQGTVNGAPVRRSLLRFRQAGYVLVLDQPLRKAAGLRLGDLASVTLAPDLSTPEDALPPELEAIFRQERALRRFFQALPGSVRRYIAGDIATPKSQAARTNRADRWAETLLLTQEAEQSLPPILTQAFAREPLAHRRWLAAPVGKRRQQLITLFRAATPETRAARAENLVNQYLPPDRRTS